MATLALRTRPLLFRTPALLHLNSFHRTFHATRHNFAMVQVLKTQADFDREIKYEGLTVIDFFATWCGPCKVLAPKIDKFSEENETVHFFKIDVDESPEVSQENGITAMPTVLFFKNGEKVGTVVGANVQEISKLINENK